MLDDGIEYFGVLALPLRLEPKNELRLPLMYDCLDGLGPKDLLLEPNDDEPLNNEGPLLDRFDFEEREPNNPAKLTRPALAFDPRLYALPE